MLWAADARIKPLSIYRRCNRPRCCAGPIEATAIGNIVCQMIASGELADLKQGRAMIADSFETTVYHPADTAAWDAKYVDFLKLIKH